MFITGAYYLASGEITKQIGGLEEEIALNMEDGEFFIHTEQVDPALKYIDPVTIAVADRPSMSLGGVVYDLTEDEVMTITGIPVGTSFLHPDGESIINDGVVEWSVNTAGVYILRFQNFPYQEEYIRVDV